MLTFNDVKNNPQVLEFVNQSKRALADIQYTEHGLDHVTLVSDRARTIAKEIGLSKTDQELSAVAAFCHDMGNFLGRTQHHYWGALLFHQIFSGENSRDLALVMQAIANHDKGKEMKLASPISAIVVLADKSDVRRNRVLETDFAEIKRDIHDRVNYATTDSKLGINKKSKLITLTLKIDTKFCPIMDYFEIFTERMTYCRESAKFLGYNFGLVINQFKLL
ncbi:MAG: HD domain-containing protein [Candidatus Nealsonbacteria bacterium]|nr:HD domain-containing protein [Candidatus Nealsonbacteria bacterium]